MFLSMGRDIKGFSEIFYLKEESITLDKILSHITHISMIFFRFVEMYLGLSDSKINHR